MQTLIPASAKRSLLTVAALGSLLVSPAAHAATTIIDWGGKYVSSHTSFSGTQEVEGAGIYKRYSMSESMLEAGGVNFYGATALYHSTGSAVPSYETDRYGIRALNPDAITLGAMVPAGSSLTIRGLLFIQKEDFLNGAKDTAVTFDNESSLSVTVSNSASSGRSYRFAVYALVEGEWNWYLSSQSAGGSTTLSMADAHNASWALFSISEESLTINPAPSSSSYTFTGSAFDDIGAVGVYFNMPYTATDKDSLLNFSFNSFQVDAHFAPIPEGSTVGMMLLGSGLLLTGLRFRRK